MPGVIGSCAYLQEKKQINQCTYKHTLEVRQEEFDMSMVHQQMLECHNNSVRTGKGNEIPPQQMAEWFNTVKAFVGCYYELKRKYAKVLCETIIDALSGEPGLDILESLGEETVARLRYLLESGRRRSI